jgi:2-aminoadipate transaminase
MKQMGLPWEAILDGTKQRLRSSAIRDLLAVTAQPDVISFAGGLPAPELFPVEALRASFDAVLREDGRAALQYGPTEGHRPLREYIASRLATRGLTATADDILVTTGSQQALDLLAKVLLRPQSTVLVEAPSYVGALQALTLQEVRFMHVPMDGQGMEVARLRELLARTAARPALCYTVATFQNPTGVTMSAARRHALIVLSQELGMPVIEDDPYGELRYDGAPVTPMRAMPGGEDIIYLGSFSKILAPGLRVGYIVAPRALLARLVLAKQAADLHTDSLAQRAVLHFCTHNDLEAHILTLKGVYGARRDAMLASLARHFPPTARWTTPEGGLFTWVTLPEDIDAVELLRVAVTQKVAFVPGSAFFSDGSGRNCLRLNFSHASADVIDRGIARLGAVVTTQLADVTPTRVLEATVS